MHHNAPSKIRTPSTKYPEGSNIYQHLVTYSEQQTESAYQAFTRSIRNEHQSIPSSSPVKLGIMARRAGAAHMLDSIYDEKARIDATKEYLEELAGNLYDAKEAQQNGPIQFNPTDSTDKLGYAVYAAHAKKDFNGIYDRARTEGAEEAPLADMLYMQRKQASPAAQMQPLSLDQVDIYDKLVEKSSFKNLEASMERYLIERNKEALLEGEPLDRKEYDAARQKAGVDKNIAAFIAEARKEPGIPEGMPEHAVEYAKRVALRHITAISDDKATTLPSYDDIVSAYGKLAFVAPGDREEREETREALDRLKAQYIHEAAPNGLMPHALAKAIDDAKIKGYHQEKAHQPTPPEPGFFDNLLTGLGMMFGGNKTPDTSSQTMQTAPTTPTTQPASPKSDTTPEQPHDFGDKLYKETAAYGFTPSDKLPPKPKSSDVAFNR
jgi:hypothetical protein